MNLGDVGIVLMIVGFLGIVTSLSSALIDANNKPTPSCYEDAEAITLNDGEQWCANYDEVKEYGGA